MAESILSQTPPLLSTASPPPKCAICLGACNNKCYSDSCMHEFCFSCLLEWSKIKAECPLCKKTFKSILHNIKSNEDYEEYVVADHIPVQRPIGIDVNEYVYIPPIPSRHFQFRTTFTVDHGGELAIQQLLLSHSLPNNTYSPPIHPRYRPRNIADTRNINDPRFRLAISSATAFRRQIYSLNYWVSAPPDVTGRYRDVSPEYYRENPAARNRLAPWLNRELNALLDENTRQIMILVDIIMEHLPRYHVRSRIFKNLLIPYIGERTEHFLHEFYNFMRSPYDMVGYDSHINYLEAPRTYTFSVSDYEDEDSDVAIVDSSQPVTIDNNPFRQPTIEVIEINSSDSHESDVIFSENPVEVVDLLQSDSENTESNTNGGQTPTLPYRRDRSDSSDHAKPLLPIKLRLKRKHLPREKTTRKKRKSSKRYSSCSTCCSSSDSSNSSSASSVHRRTKKRRKYKKSKNRSYKEYKKSSKSKRRSHKRKKVEFISSSSDSSSSSSSYSTASNSSTGSGNTSYEVVTTTNQRSFNFDRDDADDNIPLSKIRKEETQKKSKSHTVTSKISKSSWLVPPVSSEQQQQPSCSMWESPSDDYIYNYPENSVFPDFPPLRGYTIDNRPSHFDPQIPSPFTMSGTPGYQQPTTSYHQPHVAFTPPVDFYKNSICYGDNPFSSIYNQDNHRTPICVDVSVGTSAVKHNASNGYLNYGTCGGNSARLPSFIIKKEDKLLPTPTLYLNDSSDSDN